ncbi:MAG TPA: LUD domain-containing protein [Candidatus Limnocylindrales bacterium]|nr:LUD domain-containing protein [Candidatus Limnocylindrales bacterium]
MTSKQTILQAIKKSLPPEVPLPDLQGLGVCYENPEAQFAEILKAVGGSFFRVKDIEALNRELKNLKFYQNARKIVSLLPGVGEPTVDLESVEDPHHLEDVEVAILKGEFAVAENGAVWVTDRGLRHRAIYFITQHLILVVEAHQLVHNMHQAYERLAFINPGYGAFISGPSKTADIEQALVIGAHGPRSCTVFLVG